MAALKRLAAATPQRKPTRLESRTPPAPLTTNAHEAPPACPPRCGAGAGVSGRDRAGHRAADAALGHRQRRGRALAHGAVHGHLGGLRDRPGGGGHRHLLEPAGPGAGDGAVSAGRLRHDDLGHADGPLDRRAPEAAHPAVAADRDPRALDGRCALGGAGGVAGHAGVRGRGGAVAHAALRAARRHGLGRGAVAGRVSFDFGLQQRGLFHLVGQRDALRGRPLGAGAADVGDRGRRAGLSGAQRAAGAAALRAGARGRFTPRSRCGVRWR